MTTERQLQYEREKEDAKRILSTRLGMKPTMMNVNKFIALRRRGISEDQALGEVSQAREEKYKQTKKYAREQGIAVPVTPRKPVVQEAAKTVQQPKPVENNLESEFLKYYGNTINKTRKMRKPREPSVIPGELRNLSQKDRIDFYRNIATNAYEQKYGKKPTARVASTMATMFNRGYTDEQIFNAISGKRTTRKNQPVTVQPVITQAAKAAESRNLPQKERIDFYRNIATNAYEQKYGKKPTASVASTMATMINKGYTDEQIFNAISGKRTTRKNQPATVKPYNPFNEFNDVPKTTTRTRTTRSVKAAMTSCQLCDIEKSGILKPEDKAIIENIYMRYQPRTNNPSTVYPNPFNTM